MKPLKVVEAHANPLKLLTLSCAYSVAGFGPLNLKIKKNMLFLYFLVSSALSLLELVLFFYITTNYPAHFPVRY